jgi:hypothetical protein
VAKAPASPDCSRRTLARLKSRNRSLVRAVSFRLMRSVTMPRLVVRLIALSVSFR